MVELCHEIGAFIETICFHQSIEYVLLINFHQTCDFLMCYDLNNHMSVESFINSKYCVNYERLKTKKNKENHKVTHSAQSFYGKVWSTPSEKWSNSDISTRCNFFFIIWSRKNI